MLIDDLRADAHAKKGRLFWVGCDTRKGDMADGFSSEELDAEFLSILDSAVVYDCAPLTPMLTQQYEGKQIRFVRDCFGPLPPFPITAIDQKIGSNPALILFQSSAVTEPPTVMDYFLKETALQRAGQNGVGVARFSDSEPQTTLTDARWMVSVSVVVPLINGAVAMLDNFLAYFCDSRGQLLTAPIANVKLNDLLQLEPDTEKTVAVKKLLELALRHFNCSLGVLNLMACKNISSEPRKIPEKLQAARRRRGKPPLVEHRVLTVTLPGKAVRGVRAKDLLAHAGEPQPLQAIPGQYRDYRENGLFGKYKGIFWVPAHVRGTAEAGEVKTKTYRATPGQTTGAQHESSIIAAAE